MFSIRQQIISFLFRFRTTIARLKCFLLEPYVNNHLYLARRALLYGTFVVYFVIIWCAVSGQINLLLSPPYCVHSLLKCKRQIEALMTDRRFLTFHHTSYLEGGRGFRHFLSGYIIQALPSHWPSQNFFRSKHLANFKGKEDE